MDLLLLHLVIILNTNIRSIMREYAKVSPKIWINNTGRKLKKLGIEVQFVALYLQTNPHANMIGIYYLPISLIAHETGLSNEAAKLAVSSLCSMDFCSYDAELEYVWVHDMAMDQIAEQLKPYDNRVKSVNLAFSALPELSFLDAIYKKYARLFLLDDRSTLTRPSEAPCVSLRSQEKEQEQEQEQEKEQEKEQEITMSGLPDVVTSKDLISFFDDQSSCSYKTQSLEVLDFLNSKVRRAYRPVDTNLKLITARLKSGATVTQCRQVIAKKARRSEEHPKMAEYL